MKRTTPLKKHGVVSSDPYTNLSHNQLAAIGAVTLMYNECEDYLDDLVAKGLDLPINAVEVTTRINGADGKVEIAKVAAKRWGFDDDEMRIMADTLGNGGFKLLKGYRDAVLHARVFDIQSSVGRSKQGKGTLVDVLLSQDALNGLFIRLNYMRSELHWLGFAMLRRRDAARDGISDQEKARHELESRAGLAQVQERQNLRKSLQPLPEFPPDKLDLTPLRNPQVRAAMED